MEVDDEFFIGDVSRWRKLIQKQKKLLAPDSLLFFFSSLPGPVRMFLKVCVWAERVFERDRPLCWASPELTSALLAFGLGNVAQEGTILVFVGKCGNGTDVGIERIVGII